MRKHRWKMLLLLLFSVTLIGCSEKKMVKVPNQKNSSLITLTFPGGI